MIHKLILSGSFDFNDPSVSLVPLHSRGVDHGWMQKRAAAPIFDEMLRKLAADGGLEGHTVLHVFAVGDEERYGPNRNMDGFSEKDNRTAHTKFKKQGHVFKNHKNWDPQFKTGSILDTAHNAAMGRIELLAALENAKYASELAQFEKGEDISVSMGSLQPFDVCSYCKHEAPTAKDHCAHIKEKLGEVLADGRQIYMQNPDPGYFDLSTVWKPADRIGYALRKVAAAAGAIGGHELAEALGLRGFGTPKHATLTRLAAIEKRVAGKGVAAQPQTLSASTLRQLKTAVAMFGVDAVLQRLHSSGQMLGYSDFLSAIVGHDKVAGEAALTGVTTFSDLLDSDSEAFAESLDGSVNRTPMWFGEDVESELFERVCMKQAAVQARVLSTAIITPAAQKRAAASIDPVQSDGFSRFYLHYKLAFASHLNNRDNPQTLAAVATSCC
jgi:hypothetical protein